MEREKRKPSPKEKASCLSALFFWWMKDIVWHTRNGKIEDEHIYSVLHTDHASIHGEKLEQNWLNHLSKCAKNNKTPSFRWVLFTTYALKFLMYGFFSLAEECLFRMVQVVAIGYLVKYFVPEKSKEFNSSMAYVSGGGIVLASICFFITFHWSMFNTHHICTHIRLGVSSMIFRKTLRLSQATMRSFSTGQLITLLSSDVYRFDMQDLHLNYLWIAPIQLFIVIYLLSGYYNFGYASLSGLGLLVVFVIFQYIMAIYVSRVRHDKIGATNKRMRIISEIMSAFYNIKLYAWENAFYHMARETRRVELRFVKTTMLLKILNASFTFIITKMTVLVTLLLYISTGNYELDAERVFVTLMLYEHVRLNLAHLFTRGAVDFAEVSVTTRRITEFLLLEEKYANPKFYKTIDVFGEDEEIFTTERERHYGIYMKGVSCKWLYDQDSLTLEDIHLEVTAGTLLTIVGPTASGKSSCLAAILGELPIVAGKAEIKGRIGYVSQTPWLFPGTIRQNILFGKSYNSQWFQTVVDLCGLKTDFDTFEGRDETKVSHLVLSTGQMARISLARALYANCDIYLLDDPLNCVDARLQRHIMEKCIRGALKSKTVVLVTHQLQFLESMDNIAIFMDGKIRAHGTLAELAGLGINFSKFPIARKRPDVETNKTTEVTEQPKEQDYPMDYPLVDIFVSPQQSASKKTSLVIIHEAEDQLIVSLEEQEDVPEDKGSDTSWFNKWSNQLEINTIVEDEAVFIQPEKIGLRLFWTYIRASSSWVLIIILAILCIAVQGLLSTSEYRLEEWTKHEEERQLKVKTNPSKKLDPEEVDDRRREVIIYCALIASLVVASVLRSLAMFKICMNASLTLFCQLLTSLLHSKAKFFESSGHGINRFAKDMIVLDELLPTTLYDITGIFLEVLGAIGLLIFSNPWTAIPSAIFLIVSFFLYRVYHKTAITLKRFEANARSPIFAHTAKTLDGITTIRAFNQEDMFLEIFEELQDVHTSIWYLYISLNTLLSLMVDLASVLLIAAVVLILVLGEESLKTYLREPAFVGLVIVKAIELSILMIFAVSNTADAETEMIAVERILEYSHEETEDPWDNPKAKPPPYWPMAGDITFKDVTVKSGNKVLLENVSLRIESGEWIGIVGSSGAGKSTFINTLYRITEPTHGEIVIDGVKIREIGLHDLRKKLSILPQNPHIFAGTLRTNLDPLREYNDHDIWTVLNEVSLFDTVKSLETGLDTEITEAGWHFSAGQVQLIALARVLLQRNNILCFDQGTNNLDNDTQALINKKIHEKFRNRTILSVSHGIHQVMHCNKIMVIDKGRIVDYGEPYDLIQQQGPFSNLVLHLGKHNADEMLKLAKEKQKELRRRGSRRKSVVL